MTPKLRALIRKVQGMCVKINAQVGQSYRVPCVLKTIASSWHWHGHDQWFPIYPLPHNDKEVKFEKYHVHYDFRFFVESQLRRFSHGLDKHFYVHTLSENDMFSYQTLNCFRDTTIPSDSLCEAFKVGELDRLKDNEKNLRLLEQGICPHKGFKFDESCVRGREGQEVFHCPLHGLKFLMKDGRRLNCGKAESKL